PETMSSNETAEAIAKAAQQHPGSGHISSARLQGMLFFGNAASLFQSLRSRVLDCPTGSPNCFALDFRQVTGLDASAVLTFSRLLTLAKSHNTVLVYVGLSEAFKRQLIRGDGLDLDSPHCQLSAGGKYDPNQSVPSAEPPILSLSFIAQQGDIVGMSPEKSTPDSP
ncbi:MAG: sodium-independent anion transporter, partial [Elainellaceae cyanobacterium]